MQGKSHLKKNININSPKCDIFSLSIILWQMINGINDRPFKNASLADEQYQLIINKQYNLFWKHHSQCRLLKMQRNDNDRFEYEQLKKLFLQMFEFEQNRRISAKMMLRNAWLRDTLKKSNFSNYVPC